MLPWERSQARVLRVEENLISFPPSGISCHIDESKFPVGKTLHWWSQAHSCLCTPWQGMLDWALPSPVEQNHWGPVGNSQMLGLFYMGGPRPERRNCCYHTVPMMLREWPVLEHLGWKERTLCIELICFTLETVMSQRAGLLGTAFLTALEKGK